MTARELEALMVKQFGPDFREKAIVGPVGSFALADAFAECGLRDPAEVELSVSCGLWQMAGTALARLAARERQQSDAGGLASDSL